MKLDLVEQKSTEVFTRLSTINEDNNLLRNNLYTLNKRVEFLKINKSTFNEVSFEDFIVRQARSKNITLLNVPEMPIDSNNSDTSILGIIFLINSLWILNQLQINVSVSQMAKYALWKFH